MMFMLKFVPCLTCSFIRFASRLYFSFSLSVLKCVVVPSPMVFILWILIWGGIVSLHDYLGVCGYADGKCNYSFIVEFIVECKVHTVLNEEV